MGSCLPLTKGSEALGYSALSIRHGNAEGDHRDKATIVADQKVFGGDCGASNPKGLIHLTPRRRPGGKSRPNSSALQRAVTTRPKGKGRFPAGRVAVVDFGTWPFKAGGDCG